MADLDDLYKWLQGATFRHTSLDQRKMVERLIAEGRAEWVNPWNRARAIPNPAPKPKRGKALARAELNAADSYIAQVLEGIFPIIERHLSAHERVQRLRRLLDERQEILRRVYPEQAAALDKRLAELPTGGRDG